MSEWLALKCTGDHYLEDLSYRLRYDAYKKGSYISSNIDEKFVDSYDTDGSSETFITIKGDNVVASVRCCRGLNNMPITTVFADEIKSYCQENLDVYEFNRFVTSPYISVSGIKEVPFAFRLMYEKAGLDKNAKSFVGVRENHVKFYEKKLGYKKIADARPYTGLNFNTVLMMSDGLTLW